MGELKKSMTNNGLSFESVKNFAKNPNIKIEPEKIAVNVASDAIMDLEFQHVGFVSTAGPFSKTAYKPTISLVVTLINPSTKAVIYRETVSYGSWNPFVSSTIDSEEKYTWSSHEEVLKHPQQLEESLSVGSRLLSQYIADTIAGKKSKHGSQ